MKSVKDNLIISRPSYFIMAEVLEGSHKIKILLYLLVNGSKTKKELQEELHLSPGVLLRALKELERAELVTYEIERIGIRKIIVHRVTLTPIGRKVAENLQHIDEVLKQRTSH